MTGSLFDKAFSGVDCPGRENCIRGYNLCGTCNKISAGAFSGHCWVFSGGDFSVTRFEIAFNEDVDLTVDLPGGIHIVRYKAVSENDNEQNQLLCCCENKDERRGKVRFNKNSKIYGTEIILTEQFCKKCGSCRNCLYSSATATPGTHGRTEMPELKQIFEQIEQCGFPVSAATIYYEGKALEILAVLAASCRCAALGNKTHASTKSDNDFILLAQRYINENCGSVITIATLAQIACMSPSKLKYSFRRLMGKSVLEYITDVRIVEAKRLLTETGLTIERVAQLVGYKKSGAFSAVFKKCVGASPSEYRAAHKHLHKIQGTVSESKS